MNILFDLDGTLVDARRRLYDLFIDLTFRDAISYDHYWDLKRSSKDHAWILKGELGKSNEFIKKFGTDWMDRIESDHYLAFDTLFEQTMAVLSGLRDRHQLYVVTSRQSRVRAVSQLKRLGIHDYFAAILVTEQAAGKVEMIRATGLDEDPGNAVIIGDTGVDISAAHELGMASIAVLSGFRNRESLLKYRPDYIVDGIAAVPGVVDRMGTRV